MPSKLDNRPDSLNKAESDYERKFNRPMGPGDTRSQQDYGDESHATSASSDSQATAESLRERETGASQSSPDEADIPSREKGGWSTNLNPRRLAKGTNSKTNVAARLLTRRNIIAGSGLLGLIVASLLLLGTIFSPSGITLFVKEVGSRWALKYPSLSLSRSVTSVTKIQLYGDPDCSSSTRWGCSANVGVDEKFLTLLREQGFRLDGQTAVNDDASRFNIRALLLDRSDGTTLRVEANEFNDAMQNRPEFRAPMDRVLNGLAVATRGEGGLDTYRKFGSDRKSPITTSADPEEQQKDFRKAQVQNSPSGSISTEAGDTQDDNDQTRANREGFEQIIGDIDTDGISQSDYIEEGTNAANLPSTNNFNNPEQLSSTVQSTLTGTLKGGLMSWFSSVDNACAIYQTIRVLNFTMKALMVAPLFQYFMMFAVTADRIKAGVATPEEVSLIGDALTLPSVEAETRGMTFSDSSGYQMITTGIISDPSRLAQYSTGMAGVRAMSMVFDFINSKNLSANVCGAVTSTAGQITLILGGLVSCALTVGAGCVSGAAIGLVGGALLGVIAAYAIPLIAQALVGIVTPDAFTHPQRSLAVGEAFGAAASVFGDQVGQSNAMSPLTEEEYAQLHQETRSERQTMLAADTINDRRNGLFSSENPMSLTNRLAVTSLPYISRAQQGATGTVLALGQIATTGIGSLLPSTVGALSPLDPGSTPEDYGGRYCGDPNYKEEGYVVTGTCGLVRGTTPSSLAPMSGEDDHEFGFRRIMNWMQDNDYLVDRTDINHSDPPEQLAKGGYKDFIDTCINTSEPIITDGWSMDGSKRVGEECVSKEEKEEKFRAAYRYGIAMNSVQHAGNKTLGQDGSASSGGTETPGEIDLATLYDSSENIACAAGTEDRGIYDGYHSGEPIPIRVCEITNFPSGGSESSGGYGFSDAKGGLLVNSRVSAVFKAIADAMVADGQSPQATSGFRTMAHQQVLWNQYGASRAARPGYSNHQMGIAIDIDRGATLRWFEANANDFGLKQNSAIPDGLGEDWHWSPTGR